METKSVATRIAAALVYVLALAGAVSVFWDIWGFQMFPSVRTVVLLLAQLAVLPVTLRLHEFVWNHAKRAVSVHVLAYVMWVPPWAIFALERIGFLQMAWRRVDGPYFVVLVAASVVIGMGIATYSVELIQDALEGKLREPLLRSRRRVNR